MMKSVDVPAKNPDGCLTSWSFNGVTYPGCFDVDKNGDAWCSIKDSVYISGGQKGVHWQYCTLEDVSKNSAGQTTELAKKKGCVEGEWYVGKPIYKNGPGSPVGFKGPYKGCTKTAVGEGALSWCPMETVKEEYSVYTSGGKQDSDWKYCDVVCEVKEDCGQSGECSNGCMDYAGSQQLNSAFCVKQKGKGVCVKGEELYNQASGNCKSGKWYYQKSGGGLAGSFEGCTKEDDSQYWCALADSSSLKKSYAIFDGDSYSIGAYVCPSYEDAVKAAAGLTGTACATEGGIHFEGDAATHVCDKGKWLSLENFGVGDVVGGGVPGSQSNENVISKKEAGDGCETTEECPAMTTCSQGACLGIEGWVGCKNNNYCAIGYECASGKCAKKVEVAAVAPSVVASPYDLTDCKTEGWEVGKTYKLVKDIEFTAKEDNSNCFSININKGDNPYNYMTTLDCQGHTIKNIPTNFVTGGINVNGEKIRIKNCVVEGFSASAGIYVTGDNNELVGNTVTNNNWGFYVAGGTIFIDNIAQKNNVGLYYDSGNVLQGYGNSIFCGNNLDINCVSGGFYFKDIITYTKGNLCQGSYPYHNFCPATTCKDPDGKELTQGDSYLVKNKLNDGREDYCQGDTLFEQMCDNSYSEKNCKELGMVCKDGACVKS